MKVGVVCSFAGILLFIGLRVSVAVDTSPLLHVEKPAPAMATDKHAVDCAVAASTNFALDLYARLAKENENRNVFCSPYAVFSALAMLAKGATGETAVEMGKVLHVPPAAAQLVARDLAVIHAGMAATRERLLRRRRPRGKERRRQDCHAARGA